MSMLNAVLKTQALSAGFMTPGRLIKELEQAKAVLEVDAEEPRVVFDFPEVAPGSFSSYRGYYDHLALSYVHTEEPPTLSEFLHYVKEVIGATFEGYKGGQFVMDENTPIWVAAYGRTSSCALVRTHFTGWRIYLATAFTEI